jgi:hypothetical protein
MAFLTFGGNQLTFGGIPLVFGTGVTPPTPSTGRGDDAFRSSGVRERFWAEKAEDWLQERLEQIPQVAKRPKRARRRFAEALLQRVEAEDIPQPRVDALAALLTALVAPAPDYTALALDAQEWLSQMARVRRQWRDERDIAALQALGEL